MRRLAAGIASAELAETRDDDATRHRGTSLPPGTGSRFASLFDDADATGDALHVALSFAGPDESPSDVVALLSEPVDGHGVTGSRGGPLVLAEALVRRWVTVEAGETATHDDLDLATTGDLTRLLAIATAEGAAHHAADAVAGGSGGVSEDGRSAGLRARVMVELVRTSSFAQQSFSTVSSYERNTAPLETTAVGWVVGMPEAIVAMILRPTRSPGEEWSRAVGGRHEPLLSPDELAGLVGAFAVGAERARSAKRPDAPYRALVEGEVARARDAASSGSTVEATALRLGFFEQAASAALVDLARRQDTVNQSMWRTLAEARAVALSWKQGPVAFGSAVATVVGGDTNRTAADDLTISIVRSDIELEQTLADESRSSDLASVVASIAVSPQRRSFGGVPLRSRRPPRPRPGVECAAGGSPPPRAARRPVRCRRREVRAPGRPRVKHLAVQPDRPPAPGMASRRRSTGLGDLPRGRNAHTRIAGAEQELVGRFDRLHLCRHPHVATWWFKAPVGSSPVPSQLRDHGADAVDIRLRRSNDRHLPDRRVNTKGPRPMRWEVPTGRMTDDEQVEELLTRALDDWLHPGDVFDVARHAAPEDDESYIEQAILLTRRLLLEGLVLPGDVTEAGFQPWHLTETEALERIAAEWRADHEAAPTSFAVWLAATQAGEERGERLIGARGRPAD